MATVTIDLAKLEGMAEEKATRGVQAAALRGEAILKADILNRAGTGKRYGKHTASAPGEPPAPDDGRLKGATQADTQVRRDGGDLVGRVVSNVEYAIYLEKGTKNTARSLTADALRGLNTSFNQKNANYGPARVTALESEVGTERMAARPFLSKLKSDHADDLLKAFVAGAKT